MNGDEKLFFLEKFGFSLLETNNKKMDGFE